MRLTHSPESIIMGVSQMRRALSLSNFTTIVNDLHSFDHHKADKDKLKAMFRNLGSTLPEH